MVDLLAGKLVDRVYVKGCRVIDQTVNGQFPAFAIDYRVESIFGNLVETRGRGNFTFQGAIRFQVAQAGPVFGEGRAAKSLRANRCPDHQDKDRADCADKAAAAD